MEESYCGRSCRDCKKKELIRCSGCKTETINQLGSDCELAKCAYEKGLDSCRMCEKKGSCSGLRTREEMPNYQSRESQNVYLVNKREEERKAMLARRAPLLGKWLWILFWISILSSGTNLLTEIPSSVLYILGTMISVILGIARGIIFIKISSEESGYRLAGIFTLILVIADIILQPVDNSGNILWTLLITLPIAIVGCVGIYLEFMAHAKVLENVDWDLSEKWEKLGKWYIGLIIGMAGSTLMPVLGLLVVLAGAIGILVCGVLSWFYLYCTAKIFREYDAR